MPIVKEKAFINVIPPEDAVENLLKRAYKRVGGDRGTIANVHQSQSLNPKAMLAHLDLYMAVMYADSPLTRIQRELIGAIVSFFNGCQYCIVHHYEALKFHWSDAPSIDDLSSGEKLNTQDRALVSFVKKLTLNAPRMIKQDCNMLRDNNFSERAILDITLIVGYFNFVNRLVLGLGVTLEDKEDRNYKY